MRSAQSQLSDQTKVVLLIDDTQRNFDKIHPVLAQHTQYSVESCHSHVEAFSRLQAGDVDLILFSCSCSPLPCPSIIADLHRSYPSIPIIALSEHIDDEQGQQLLDGYAADYLSTDTLNAEILLRSLRYALNTSKQHHEIQVLRDSDMLTMVSNRQSFYIQLKSKLAQQSTNKRQLVLITVDLDEFRKFNSHYGFSTGDRVVLEMGSRIQSTIRADEIVARLGSDEFAMLLDLPPEADLKRTTKDYLNKLLTCLDQPYCHGNIETRIHCSIGVTFAPEHSSEIDKLTRFATHARMNAKQVHGCSYAYYRPGMEENADNRTELGADMTRALHLNQFELYYQPRIDLGSGEITGAEALIRWNHPVHGLVMPGDFIPLSERNGMIVSIGYWVLYQAGKHLKALREEGLSINRLGINLSFRQFKDDRLVETIKRIIKQEEIDTSVLEFELTESAIFSDEEHVRSCLTSLAEEGITFSLDDFGTGYSSFSLLHKLPISALKIDRSFVSQVNESSEAAEIVRSIISLTQNMSIKVIAEGVETRQQLEFLIKHDCDEIQGFFFSPPVPFADFKRMLSKPGKKASGE